MFVGLKTRCQIILRENGFFRAQMKGHPLKQCNKFHSTVGIAPKDLCMEKTQLPMTAKTFSCTEFLKCLPEKGGVSSDSFVLSNISTTMYNKNKNLYLSWHSNFPKFHHSLHSSCGVRAIHVANYSTGSEKGNKTRTDVTQLTYAQNFKIALRDYGLVMAAFYLGTTFVSLLSCYCIIRSGACHWDVFKDWGIDEGAATAGVAATLIVAYAVHKTLLPWRMGLTLAVSPFLVRKLRNSGYLKSVKPKQV